MKLIVIFIILPCLMVHIVNSSNILGLFAFPGKSHFMVFKSIMIELSRRNHNVTVVSNFRIDDKIPNYNEIVVTQNLDYWSDVKSELGKSETYSMKDLSTIEVFKMMNIIGKITTENFLKDKNVEQIINRHEEDKYDLIIVEEFYQDAVLAIANIYKAPVVAITTSSFENHMSSMLGLIIPWAHYPQDFLPYTDKMNFWERVHNVYSSLYCEYNRKFNYYPQQDAIVEKYFSKITDTIPPVEEMRKQVAILLVNSFIPLDYARPLAPSMINIGGAHVPQPKNLPWDVKRFLDDARNGAIYFSMGTNLKCSDLPEQKLKVLTSVFSKLKEHVLWQCDNEKLIEDLPHNIKLKNWVAQSDVLAHPHLKYFITHGGMLSLQEALYRNVPVLGIPIFGDQHINMEKVVSLGIGIKLDFDNLTDVSLTWALQKLLYDPSYVIEMRKISQMFRDRPLGAMETAIYWIDYAVRYHGASHLKMASVHSNWYQLYLIDVIIFTTSVIMFIIFIFYGLVKFYILYKKNYSKGAKTSKLDSKNV